MSYRLDSKEPVATGLKRIVREEIDAALAHIAVDSGTDRDKAIHEARKSIKKIRAVLRLIRPEFPKLYGRENRRVRAIARELSSLRDAAAIIETLDELAGGVSRLRSIRAGLIEAKAKSESKTRIEDVLRDTSASLNKLKRRVEKWPLKGAGLAAFEPGVKKAYRRGRRLLRLARKHPDPPIWHELRKRVKDHWYHVRLLEAVSPRIFKARERPLDELETALGTDHNLVVLADELRKNPERFRGDKAVSMAMDLIGRYQRKLREEALKLGSKLYREKTYGAD